MVVNYYRTEFDSALLLVGKHEILKNYLFEFLSENRLDVDRIANLEINIDVQAEDDLQCAYDNLLITIGLLTKKIPSITITPIKSPATNDESTLLITYFNDEQIELYYKVFQKKHYVVVLNGKEKLLYSGGIRFNIGRSALENIQLAFDFTEQLLDHEEMHFGHLIHLNYAVEDFGTEQVFEGNNSDYADMVEKVCQLYFDPVLFQRTYPSSSIIGTDLGGMQMCFVAGSKDSFSINQVTEDYSFDKQTPTAPFSYLKDMNQIFISGISPSMFNEEVGDNIIKQTEVCVSHIKKNILSNKLEDHNKGYDTISLQMLKVYIRNDFDFEDVKLMIEQQLKAKEYIYLLSDVPNKSDLLMVEGIASYE